MIHVDDAELRLERAAGSAELVVVDGRSEDFVAKGEEGVILELSVGGESFKASDSIDTLATLVYGTNEARRRETLRVSGGWILMAEHELRRRSSCMR